MIIGLIMALYIPMVSAAGYCSLSLDDATIGVATTYTFDFMPGSPVPGKVAMRITFTKES